MKTIRLGTSGDALKKVVDALPFCRHCQGCQGADPDIPDPVHHASMELTGQCNHACIFCYSRIAQEAGTIPKPGYYGEQDPGAITISQYGEPCTVPEKLVDAIRGAREAFGNVRLDLQTNGTLLTPELWSRLAGELDLCMVSVEAADRQLHRTITGANTFDALQRGLDLVGGSRVWSIVRMVDLPGINDTALPAIAEMARSAGIDELMVHQCAIHEGNRDRLVAAGLDMDAAAYVPGLALRVARAAEDTGMRMTLQGCVLATLKTMDAETLPFLTKDARSDVPVLKRERSAMPRPACGKDCPGCPHRSANP